MNNSRVAAALVWLLVLLSGSSTATASKTVKRLIIGFDEMRLRYGQVETLEQQRSIENVFAQLGDAFDDDLRHSAIANLTRKLH
jgi:hypothetical protein